MLPDQRWIGAILIALAVLLLVFDVHIDNGRLVASRKKMLSLFLIASGGLLIIAGLVLRFEFPAYDWNVNGTDSSDNKSVTKDDLNALSLEILWKTDFNTGSYKIIQEFETVLFSMDGSRIGTFTYGVGLYGDFSSKSIFMSLYVPGTAHGFDLAKILADQFPVYLEDAKTNIHVWTSPSGDQSQPISDNLQFTNVIYVYLDNVFNDQQMNDPCLSG